ncbi:hypothetical protein [Amycolatopsis tolypomycina]|uniref:hypothetical protein n=1 Tax=Amycolatopsis tolypomycina TaxID=208445 RepID=UPI0033BE99A5
MATSRPQLDTGIDQAAAHRRVTDAVLRGKLFQERAAEVQLARFLEGFSRKPQLACIDAPSLKVPARRGSVYPKLGGKLSHSRPGSVSHDHLVNLGGRELPGAPECSGCRDSAKRAPDHLTAIFSKR